MNQQRRGGTKCNVKIGPELLWEHGINPTYYLQATATEVVPAMTSQELKSTSHYHKSKQQEDCNPTSYSEPPNADSRM